MLIWEHQFDVRLNAVVNHHVAIQLAWPPTKIRGCPVYMC